MLMAYHVISILSLALLITFMKLLMEDSLLLILMTMEATSMLSFFLLLGINTESLCLTSCTITMLTVMISESVLSLAVFISLMRSLGQESILSLKLKY